ncbi:MAG: alpha/beta fold hydrolase, partial [Acidimicrobiales bacterium]
RSPRRPLRPADRPAQLVAPADVSAPAPLLVLLHGYGGTAVEHDAYLGVTELAASRGLYVLLPDGTRGSDGLTFWDASPACCNFAGPPVDDSGYLSALIDEAVAERPIDPDRVYLFGHSNGGFMAYRLACEHAEQIAALASLAGADQAEAADCTPSAPVSVLQLHGTEDVAILYGGGDVPAPYPGAVETVTRWAERNQCDPEPVEGPRLDLIPGLEGDETAVQVFEGCAAGSVVQLDTLEGEGHRPDFDRARVGTDIIDWLLARSR